MTGEGHEFDEALISGYLDGELTQQDAQRVRLHLEDCADCRRIAGDLRTMKEATMTTRFRVPEDTQWDERPRGAVSRILHDAGLLILAGWLVGIAAYIVWGIASDAESLRFENVLVFGLLLAFGLVVLSALVDRLRVRRSDPYRKVRK
jgi:anti-sigma factor RsiW